jgi:hypothetical protein
VASIPRVDAQTFSYHTRDLLLDFHRSGSADLEVNIGSINNYKGLAAGTILTISQYDVNSQLKGNFGNLNSLGFSVIGAQKGTGADTANTSWFTLRRTDPLVQTSAPNRYTASKTASIQSAISGIAGDGTGSGALHYGSSHPADLVGNTLTAVIVPTSGLEAADSYSTKSTAVGGLSSLVASPGVENFSPADFSSGSIVSDLYEYAPGPSSAQATYLGSFTFGSDGVTTFTAVPEPGTYSMLAVGFVLFGAMHLRRSQSSVPTIKN